MLRHACAFVVFVCLAPCAFAQDPPTPLFAANSAAPIPLPVLAAQPNLAPPPAAQTSIFVPRPPATARAAKRPMPLLPMYVGFAALQAADLHSTFRALSSGAGREANPVISGVAGNTAAFAAVKAGSTVGLIWASERIWKRNRTAAVVFMAVANGIMTAVVAHNYSVGSRQ